MRDEPDGRDEKQEPNPVGQDSPGNEYGEIGDEAQSGSGSAQPRSMGTHGSEFGQFGDRDDRGQQGQSGTGQADLGSQAGSTLSGHADQQELAEAGGEVDQPASYNIEGEGFILQPESGSDERQPRRKRYRQQRRPKAPISHTGPRRAGRRGRGE